MKKVFENLCHLMSDAEINGRYYKPRIDHENNGKFNEIVICLPAALVSEISEAIHCA